LRDSVDVSERRKIGVVSGWRDMSEIREIWSIETYLNRIKHQHANIAIAPVLDGFNSLRRRDAGNDYVAFLLKIHDQGQSQWVISAKYNCDNVEIQ
jgi:hypothetical protein